MALSKLNLKVLLLQEFRRIEAITNQAVKEFYADNSSTLFEIKESIKQPKEPLKAVQKLQEENTSLQKQVAQLLKDKAQNVSGEIQNQLTRNQWCSIFSYKSRYWMPTELKT